MIAILTLAVLATSAADDALPQALLSRDLGAMERILASSSSRTGALVFFDELATFVSCGALPELKQAPLPRVLLRLEQARWRRLSPEVGKHPFFAWLERPDTFSRAPLPSQFEGAPLQVWPADAEPWPDELPQVRVRPFLCPSTEAPADELRILNSELVEEAHTLHPALSAELGLHLAARLHASGAHAEGRAVAATVTAELLPVELRSHLRLARALGDEAQLAAAAVEISGGLGPALDEHACSFLAARRDYPEVVRRFAGAESPYLLHCLAFALAELDRIDEALALVDRYPAPLPESLRSLALKLWTERATAAEAGRIARLGVPTDVWWSLGTLALTTGRLEAARLAAVELGKLSGARAQARAGALSLELAWMERDPSRWKGALRALVDEPRKVFRHSGARSERDRTLLVAAQSILLSSGAEPKAWETRLRDLIQFGADQSRGRTRADWNRLTRAVSASSGSVVGAVSLPEPLILPPPAPLEVQWPEPTSLLLVPGADGSWRRWPQPDEVKDVR